MPVRQNATISYFDGPPVVSCAAFSMHESRLSEPVDVLDHPFRDAVCHRVAEKSVEIRRPGVSGPAMLPMAELEYTGATACWTEKQKTRTRPPRCPAAPVIIRSAEGVSLGEEFFPSYVGVTADGQVVVGSPRVATPPATRSAPRRPSSLAQSRRHPEQARSVIIRLRRPSSGEAGSGPPRSGRT